MDCQHLISIKSLEMNVPKAIDSSYGYRQAILGNLSDLTIDKLLYIGNNVIERLFDVRTVCLIVILV
jgi:hypothetical protein